MNLLIKKTAEQSVTRVSGGVTDTLTDHIKHKFTNPFPSSVPIWQRLAKKNWISI